MSEMVVTQADRTAAADWESIINHRWSEYEGDAVEDLAEAFARHRIEALEQAAKVVEMLRQIRLDVGEIAGTSTCKVTRADARAVLPVIDAAIHLQGEG